MGAENLVLSSKPPETVINIIKAIKGSKAILNNGAFLYTSGISDIKIEGNTITIYRSVQHSRISVDYTLATLDKHGTTTAEGLVDHWQTNNFFFDVGGGSIFTAWEGEVEFRENLPITAGIPLLGALYLVQKPTTILLGAYQTSKSGLYIKDSDTGSLNNWRRLNVKVRFTSEEFKIVDSDDQSKQLSHDVSAFSTGINRTLQWRDRGGVPAFLDDIPIPVSQRAVFLQASAELNQFFPSAGVDTKISVNTIDSNNIIGLSNSEITFEQEGQYAMIATARSFSFAFSAARRFYLIAQQFNGSAWLDVVNGTSFAQIPVFTAKMVILNLSIRITNINQKVRLMGRVDGTEVIIINSPADSNTVACRVSIFKIGEL